VTAERIPSIDRLYDLLADRAVRPLTDAEQTELTALLAKWPHVDPDELDLAAAAVDLATARPNHEPLPPTLALKIAAEAKAHIGPGATPTTVERRRPDRRRPSAQAWAGWAVAACLAGVMVWSQWPKPQPSLADSREKLRPSATVFASAPGPATGEVVWKQAEQEGYLEVRGLPPNDPKKSQYQLWVFDGGRKSQPNDRVDGGVFDVTADGTALVPVRAALPVFDAVAFAVTEEPPGGVIVSQVPQTVRLVLAKK
jgi:hypothetical protein